MGKPNGVLHKTAMEKQANKQELSFFEGMSLVFNTNRVKGATPTKKTTPSTRTSTSSSTQSRQTPILGRSIAVPNTGGNSTILGRLNG